MSTTDLPASEEARREVVDLCAELIRFGTSNPTSDERVCADWVVARLAEAGLALKLVESAPGRADVAARDRQCRERAHRTVPVRGRTLPDTLLTCHRPAPRRTSP